MKDIYKYGEVYGELYELYDYINESNGYCEHNCFDIDILTKLYLYKGVTSIKLDVEDDYFDTMYLEIDFNKISMLELKYVMLDLYKMNPTEIEETNFCMFRLWWNEQ